MIINISDIYVICYIHTHIYCTVNLHDWHMNYCIQCIIQCFFNELNAVSGQTASIFENNTLQSVFLILILTGGSQRIPSAGISYWSDDTQHTKSGVARFYRRSNHRVLSLPQCGHEAGQVLFLAKSLVLLGRQRKRSVFYEKLLISGIV